MSKREEFRLPGRHCLFPDATSLRSKPLWHRTVKIEPRPRRISRSIFWSEKHSLQETHQSWSPNIESSTIRCPRSTDSSFCSSAQLLSSTADSGTGTFFFLASPNARPRSLASYTEFYTGLPFQRRADSIFDIAKTVNNYVETRMSNFLVMVHTRRRQKLAQCACVGSQALPTAVQR